MPPATKPDCNLSHQAEGLARGELHGSAAARVQRHLEQCEVCRAAFRRSQPEGFPDVPNYTILERIGEGGFGVVYKAIHHDKERIEALKVLFSRTPLRTAYFENEVHLIARLTHANIATLYEAQLTTPPLYYTMEFVAGRQLNEYFKSHEAPLAERIRLVTAVARAIDYAHKQGVVHRDLKPQNILIDDAGQPHIVDFGIAKKLALADASAGQAEGESGRSEGAVGTLGFIPPEQVAGGPLGPRADVFALGALLFHCVTGEPARLAGDTARLVALLRRRRVSRAEELAAIVARCVERDPERRYPTCALLVEDLENYLSGRSTSARPDPSLVRRLTRSLALVSRNLPAVVRIAAVGVAAALLLWIFQSWNVRFHEPGSATDRTVLIGFTDSTLAAIEEGRYQAALPELGPNPKSRRLLHGRLMEILARTQPRVVVWDYHFPDPQPKYDPAFIRGVKKLKEIDTPVVVGATAFDINGEPLMCAAIREAVHSYGCIVSTNPGSITNEFAVPICIERGFGDAIPGILVSAVAAWYHGDCDADLRLDPLQVTIRYRLREVQKGQRSHLDETDTIDVSEVDTITLMFPIISRPRRIGTLEADDRVYVTRVDAGDSARWRQTMVPYEGVLAADDRQLREWFAGRAVLIGEMLEGSRDEHEIRPGGARVFGCQVFAQAIDAQLRKERKRPLTSSEVGLRVGVWCALAALLVGLVPVGRRQSFPLTAWGCVMACLLGLLLAVTGAQWLTRVWLVEPLMGLSTLLSAGSLAYLAKAARERQLRLAPDWYVVPADSTDLPTTVLAEAQ